MARRLAIPSVPNVFLGVAALASGLLVSAPRQAAAEPTEAPLSSAPSLDAADPTQSETDPAVDQYPPPSARTNLVLAGVATTAVWYGLALGASYAWPDTVGANDLRIPVAGPWLALSHSGCGNVSDCSKLLVVVRAIATTLDAIGQAGGLAFVAEGLFLPTREPSRERPPARAKPSGFKWQPTFDAGKNTVGFGVLGVF